MKEEYEIWKPLKDYENYYEVSDMGKIKRIGGKILSTKSLSSGYPCFSICVNGTQRTQRVHIAVASTFLEKYSEDLVVNHKDGNKLNNVLSNLEWITPRENNIHSIENNLKQKKSTPIVQLDLEGNELRIFHSQIEAEKITGICRKQINNCAKGKQPTAHGYKWKILIN